MVTKMCAKYMISVCIVVLSTLSCVWCKGSLITLDEQNWDQMLTGEWMIDFYAPWCPACKALEPEWNTFSSWSDDLSIKIASIDVTANAGLSGRFMVTALPTIYHVKDGVFRQYKGTRDSNTFVSFVEEKKWQNIEPISSWKSPNSIQMSIVSYFFKISMALRAVHNRLVEDYGIPYWCSYILFAFATILLGAVLGLIIVCIIDLLFPAKLSTEEYKSSKQENVSDKTDFIDDDVEEDNIEDNSSDDNNANETGELRKRKIISASDDKENKDD